MKRPSFQFYPSDWLRDTALRSCSTGARGLWMDMICYMHEGNPYGYMKVGEKVILPSNLARMVGETLEVVEGWLAELKQAGVYDVAEDGSICSRRMIRDENLRQIRAAGGKLGGNPKLKDGGKVNLKVNSVDNQNTTPSSPSTSSPSHQEEETTPKRRPLPRVQKPDEVGDQTWADWLHLRKTKRAPVTETVLTNAQDEAAKAGLPLERFLQIWCARGSQGLQADWLKPSEIGGARQALPAATERNRTVMSGLTRNLIGGASNVKLLGS